MQTKSPINKTQETQSQGIRNNNNVSYTKHEDYSSHLRIFF